MLTVLSVTLALLLLLFSSVAHSQTPTPPDATPSLPTINLGYAQHYPATTITTRQNLTYHIFPNIPFTQAPTRPLRFHSPITPPLLNPNPTNGTHPRNTTNCLQSIPNFYPSPPGLPINGTTWGSEDCLYLDVIIPASPPSPPTSNETSSGGTASNSYPVLHWIHGGGYFFGAKEWSGYPAALLNTLPADEEPFVIVASNYRLGPLGWVSPGLPKTDADNTASSTGRGVDINIGLQDTLAALEWTQSYIHLFNGDPSRVTAMGQSAGSGMIQHLIAADVVGTQALPFQQAVLSSPAYRPHVNRNKEMGGLWEMWLNATGCADVDCVRGLEEEEIVKANEYMLQDVPSGPFIGPGIGFGPVVDGGLVMDVPDRILNSSSSATGCSSSKDNAPQASGNIKRVLTGGMANDGVASIVGSPKTWDEVLTLFMRTPSAATFETVKTLYGEVAGNETSFAGENGSIITPTPLDRFSGDVIFNCHTYFTGKAISSDRESAHEASSSTTVKEAYRYRISTPPALHGGDLFYYFFDEYVPALDPTVNETAAREFQGYVRRFIRGEDMVGWPGFRDGYVDVTEKGFEVVGGGEEKGLAERCEVLLELLGREEDGW